MHPNMCVCKKRKRGSQVSDNPPVALITEHRPQNPTVACQKQVNQHTNPFVPTSKMCYSVTDKISGITFLVDTGAARSLIPATEAERLENTSSSTKLVSATGADIPSYGIREMKINLAGQQYNWQFITADVSFALLGADFLGHHNLLVDVRNRKLITADSLSCATLTVATATETTISTKVEDSPFSILLQEFPSVFRPELRQDPTKPARHNVKHYITTSGPPIYSKFRRLSPEKLKIAKQLFADMVDNGLCQKSSSPWSSPLHMVKKQDGSWRPCGDYRRLNMVTEPDHYPVPNITDITNGLHGASIFSKLDLLKGYYQVPMNEEDIKKTAICTPFGTYTFNYSCFGLRNSGATFQRLMDDILGDLPFCVVYIDDILIFSSSRKQHFKHLRKILQRLTDNGLIVRYDKCVFGASSVEFLGHSISAQGVTPVTSKIDAIQQFPQPTTVKQVQEFCGMINFYHRFLPHIAETMTPLYNAIKGKPKKIEWTTECETAFKAAKSALANKTTLSFPSEHGHLILSTDASDKAMGASLDQVDRGQTHPLAFYSRKFSETETRYSAFDRELLATFSAVKHFAHWLEGKSFTIRTDHKPLVHALTMSKEPTSERQRRHLSAISEYNCTIEHVPGKENLVADALSRNITAIQLGLDYKQIAEAQESDQEIQQLKNSRSLSLKKITLEGSNTAIWCDISTSSPRPLIPFSFRKKVFKLNHDMAHLSARKTLALLRKKFLWPSMNSDIKKWCRECLPCQTSKIHKHTETGIATFAHTNERFAHIHVDVVGPLPTSNGHRYLLTIIDRATRWPDAIPLQDASANSCATALLNWISTHGIPRNLTSDRGTSFTSRLWSELAESLGVELHYTSAYNPEANGMVERWHRTLKASIMARCSDDLWFYQLPWILLGLRTAPHSATSMSPAEAVFGRPLVVPADFFHQDEAKTPRQIAYETSLLLPKFGPSHRPRKTFIPNKLQETEFVFIRTDSHRRPLQRPYTGPYKVIQRRSKVFQLLVNGKLDWVSIDRLKPAIIPQETTQPIAKRTRSRLDLQDKPSLGGE